MNPPDDIPDSVPASRPERARTGAFIITGIINTLVDFAVLNAGILLFGLPILVANIFSTSAALATSYVLNNTWVFRGEGKNAYGFLRFIIVTLFGLYVLQTLIIFALTEDRTVMAQGLHYVIAVSGAGPAHFLQANAAKVIATIASSIWNYYLYKHVVFRRGAAAKTA